MATLHITRGLPGAGKTTFARAWVAADPTTRVRVNRDDVRALIHQPYAQDATEAATTLACHALVRTFLKNRRDVIVDGTNLNSGFLRRLMLVAQKVDATVKFHDFPIHPEVAKRRLAARSTPRVSVSAVDRLSAFLGLNGELPPPPHVPGLTVLKTGG
jgi:predicted kinase